MMFRYFIRVKAKKLIAGAFSIFYFISSWPLKAVSEQSMNIEETYIAPI